MADATKKNYKLIVTPPEEAAFYPDKYIRDFLEQYGVEISVSGMSLRERILSNGGSVSKTIQMVNSDNSSVYLKGPGITPTDQQALDMIIQIEKAGKLIFSDDNLNISLKKLRAQLAKDKNYVDFAYKIYGATNNFKYVYEGQEFDLQKSDGILNKIGSPNASWRDKLNVDLYRGASQQLRESAVTNFAEFQPEELKFAPYLPNSTNTLCTQIIEAGDVNIKLGETNLAKFDGLSKGSSVRVSVLNEKSFKNWFEKVLEDNPNAKIIHGTKHTVLKAYDTTIKKWMQEVLEDKNQTSRIDDLARKQNQSNQNVIELGPLLVDDLFARLTNYPPSVETLVAVGNQSYSEFTSEVFTFIAENGGLKPFSNCEIARASSTGDHYKATEISIKDSGKLNLSLNNSNIEGIDVSQNDVVMITYLDRDKMRNFIINSLERAIETGKENVLFGFDKSDEYYKIAVEELNDIKKTNKYNGLNIEVGSPGNLTGKYFTSGVDNTMLCLGNVHGDFATDIEMFGKGTSYSVGVLAGNPNRLAIELGTGGTAPDLLDFQKKYGRMIFNPVAFLEAYALGINSLGKMMQAEKESEEIFLPKLKLSEAIQKSIYTAIKKGYVLPIISNKFKIEEGCTKKIVSTETFVKAVDYFVKQEMGLRKELINLAKNELDVRVKMDLALMELQANDKFKNTLLKINEEREANGSIDPITRDYSFALPYTRMKPEKINKDSVLNLFESFEFAIKNTNEKNARDSIKTSLMKLGVDAHVAKNLAPKFYDSITSKGLNSKSGFSVS